jgi:hypothetical protein
MTPDLHIRSTYLAKIGPTCREAADQVAGGNGGGLTLDDSWATFKGYDYNISSGNLTSITEFIGQAYTSKGGALDSAKFHLKPQGVPTGTVVARLYAATGSFPTAVGTGAPLAESDPIPVSAIASEADYTFSFTGANRYAMVNGTNYVIGVASIGGTNVMINGIRVGSDFNQDLDPKHYGNLVAYQPNATTKWGVDDYNDMTFYVYTK